MILNGIAKQLDGSRADLKEVESNMAEGFRNVLEKLDDAKIRDEETLRLLKSDMEAEEKLRESMEARFDAARKKHDETISQLKELLRRVTR